MTALIDDGGISTINVDGGASFDEGALLDVDFADGVTPYTGTWTLLDAGGTLAGSLAFAGTVDVDFTDGLGWLLNFDTTNSQVDVTYGVPEPGTVILFLTGLFVILIRRFR